MDFKAIKLYFEDFWSFSSIATVVVLMLILHHIFDWYLKNRNNLPPGPIGLPIIGNLHQVGREPHLGFMKISKKYGNIFRLKFGSLPVIVFNDSNSVYETFVKKSNIFSDRPPNFTVHLTNVEEDALDLAMLNGEVWRELRQLLTNTLKDNGVGTVAFESVIQNEIDQLIKELRQSYADSPDVGLLLNKSLNNIISMLAIGKRFDWNHPFLQLAQDVQKLFLKSIKIFSVLVFFHWVMHIPGLYWILGHGKLKKKLEEFDIMLLKEYNAFKRDEQMQTTSNCYFTAFLKLQRQKLEENKNIVNFSEKALLTNGRGLFMAGVELTVASLFWIFFYLAAYPNVQKKCQEELDRVVGGERAPSVNDKPMMPFIEATLLEVNRSASGAIGLPRSNTKQCTVGGYIIPKDSYILMNFNNMHHDPTFWKNPCEFRPERFLDENGKVNRTLAGRVFQFSAGKRSCPGESLARMETYLLFTNLIQNFTFLNPQPHLNLSEMAVGYRRRNPPFKECKIVPRI